MKKIPLIGILLMLACFSQAGTIDSILWTYPSLKNQVLRIDKLDGTQDESINISSKEINEEAIDVFINQIIALDFYIRTCKLTPLRKIEIVEEINYVLSHVTENNISNIQYYKQKFLFFYFLIRSDEKSNHKDLYLKFPSYVMESLYLLRDADGLESFLLKQCHTNPDGVLKRMNDIKNEEYALRVVKKACSESPMNVKNYLLVNTAVKSLLNANTETDSLLRCIAKIYKLTPVNSKALCMLEKIYSGKLSIQQADSIGRDKRLLLQQLIDIKRNPNILGTWSIDRELESLSLEYVREINDLHDETDMEVRFKCSNSLTAEELYTVMVYTNEEIFTSTFLGLFDRMMKRLNGKKPDAFLAGLGYNKLHTFINECSSFNTLQLFFQPMDKSAREDVLSRFMRAPFEHPGDIPVAVDVADAIGSLNDTASLRIMEKNLKRFYKQSDSLNQLELTTTYGLLCSIFQEKSRDTAWFHKVGKLYPLPNVDLISNKSMFNEKGENVQLHMFFDDKDGEASYASFLQSFSGTQWEKKEYETFVIIRSRTGKTVLIIANKPKFEREGQDDVQRFLDSSGRSPQLIVHRGHSYYAYISINKVNPQTQLVLLGSCGGYHVLSDVLDKSGDAQIISTKQIGTMLVNNPMVRDLSLTLSQGKDIVWAGFWKSLGDGLKSNPAAMKKFTDYIPPDRNMGAIFMKAYRQNL